jgi:hypothetical protein
MAAMTTSHKLTIDNPLARLHDQVWRCSCGGWKGGVPAVGGFGRTSHRARVAQAIAAHEKHVKAALKRAPKIQAPKGENNGT